MLNILGSDQKAFDRLHLFRRVFDASLELIRNCLRVLPQPLHHGEGFILPDDIGNNERESQPNGGERKHNRLHNVPLAPCQNDHHQ